jgi:hypothetical protein
MRALASSSALPGGAKAKAGRGWSMAAPRRPPCPW